MKSYSTRFASLAQRAASALVVTAGVWCASSAHAELRPGTIYGAAGVGLMASSYECKGAPGCEYDRASAKLFGGYRFTPNLAAELSYFYLGGFKATQGPGTFPADQPIATKLRNTGVSYAIDWSNEIFQVMTTHVRFGLATVRTAGSITYGNNETENVREYTTKPYLGLGLSYQMSPSVRFYSGYDVLRNKRNEHFHMLSLGLGIEN